MTLLYESAKQLKDAGFPQKGSFAYSEEYDVDTQPFYVGGPHLIPQGNWVYAPTLSELIEACGDDFEGVRKIRIEFDQSHYFLAETFSGIACKGIIWEEAVKNLWIALHSDNVPRP